MALRLDRLRRDAQIVTQGRVATDSFARLWERLVTALEQAVQSLQTAIDAVAAAQAAADSANAAAATAQAAATTAQASADALEATGDGLALENSYTVGLTVSADDFAGAGRISFSAHTRAYRNGASVAVNSGLFTGLAYSTRYYVFYDDPARAGGAVTFQISTTPQSQTGNRHLVTVADTPASGGAATDGAVIRSPWDIEP